ncbi:MAG: NUDIX domain-containing protein [Salinivirgaceae bacterium]|nr:NUDIX domain-containing protein [Salinivirgaceae bacterium]
MQNAFKYLKVFLPGLLPLLVFIVADEFLSTTNALIFALASGALVFAFTWIRYGKPDRFILFDTLLLGIFGGISIVLHNDLFFKLKPGIIQIILVAILAISAYSPRNIVLAMAKRYMPDQEIAESQLQQLRQQIKIMFWIFGAHTLLIFYSAFYMSSEAWAFISGGLFYIVAGIWFLVIFIRNKLSLMNTEWLPVLNDKGHVVGKATRDQVHSGSKVLHPVVHLHLFNAKGELYVQKRSNTKKIQPGKWDTSVGGHVSFKESPQQSLMRETKEEIDIIATDAKLLFTYLWESQIERELVYVYALVNDMQPTPHKKELAGGRFMTLAEVKKNLGKSFFTPNFEHEFDMLIKKIDFK